MTTSGPGPENGATVLQVYLLGTVDFETALAFQRRLHFEVSGDRAQAALIVCEHPPLITVGRQGSRAHIHFEPHELAAWHWPIRWVNRGGGVMLHLPGQLAVYPVVPLDAWGLAVPDFLQRFGQVLQDLLADFSVRAHYRPEPPGVWVHNRLLAGIGVAIHDWVSYFGAYLNIQPDLAFFRKICCDWRTQEPMTSLERERRGPLRTALVRERLVDHFRARFPVERIALFTDHPQLKKLSVAGGPLPAPNIKLRTPNQ